MPAEPIGREAIWDWYMRLQAEQRERALSRWRRSRSIVKIVHHSRMHGTYVRDRAAIESTRRERRTRASVGTNQPRPIRVIKFDGERCKWPQMAHCEIKRMKGTYR